MFIYGKNKNKKGKEAQGKCSRRTGCLEGKCRCVLQGRWILQKQEGGVHSQLLLSPLIADPGGPTWSPARRLVSGSELSLLSYQKINIWRRLVCVLMSEDWHWMQGWPRSPVRLGSCLSVPMVGCAQLFQHVALPLYRSHCRFVREWHYRKRESQDSPCGGSESRLWSLGWNSTHSLVTS